MTSTAWSRGSTTPRARWPPAPTTRPSRRRGRTPRTCAPHRRPSRSIARRWRRRAATSRAPCATRGTRWTWPGPEDHFVRGGARGFLGLAAWARGDVAEALTTFSEAVRSLHAGGQPGRRAGQHGGARRHVGHRRPAPPGPRAVRAGPADGDRRRRAVPAGHRRPARRRWPSSTASSTTSTGAEAHLETARVLAEHELDHREPAPLVRGLRAARAADGRPRRRRAAARPRPRRCTGRASTPTCVRSLPCGPASRSRRATSPRPRRGRATAGVPRRRRDVPARVRAPHPGAAAARPAPRAPGGRCRRPALGAPGPAPRRRRRLRRGAGSLLEIRMLAALTHHAAGATRRRRSPRWPTPLDRAPEPEG